MRDHGATGYRPLSWTDYVSGRCPTSDAIARRRGRASTCAPATCCIRSSGTRAGRRRPVRSCGSGGAAIPGSRSSMLSLSSLGALFFRGGLVRKVITGYSGDTFPNFTPNPWFARRVRARRGRGRALVVPRVRAATRSRRARAARDRRPVRSRVRRWRRTTRYARVDTPFGEVGLLAPLQPDVALLHAPVADRAGNVALHPPLLEGVWGALGGAAGRDRDRRADRRRHPAVVAPRADPRAPGARGRRVPDGRASRAGCYTGDAARRRLRRGLRLLGRRARRDPRERRVRRVDPATGCSTSRRRSSGSSSSAPNASPRCAPRPRPTRGAPTRQRSRPISTRPVERVGARRGVGRALPRRARRRARRRRGARGRGCREPVGVARRAARARRRAPTCSSPPRSGCGATTRRSPIRSC